MDTHPLDKARHLILSVTSIDDAKYEIEKFSKLPPTEQKHELDTYYATMPSLAARGDSKAISIALRVFEHFGDRAHDRMLLHYIAQAEANNALAMERRNPDDKQKIHEALEIISKAFADANALDTASQ